MAMTQAERSAKTAMKRKAVQEEELRLRVRPGTKQALAELMQWAGLEEQGEAMTLMIHHVQGLGRSGVMRLLSCERSKIECCENVARVVGSTLIRFRARPGTLSALDSLVEWIGAQDQSAVMQIVVHALHDAGPERALRFLAMPPRAPYMIPAHIAAKLQLAYNREALRICRDE